MDARLRFRHALAGPRPVVAPLCLDPLDACLIEEAGFEAGYLSGGALGFRYAVGEALLTMTEIAAAARRITARSDLALIVDGGVGFGDAVHTARATAEFEATGAVAVELEDQVAPKRLHHHVGVEHLVDTEEMVGKLQAAAGARTDSDFLIIARTGAFRHEGYEAGIERLAAYRDAGADVLMALVGGEDAGRLGAAAPSRLGGAPLAIITSLDTRPLAEWGRLGWSLIIDAFTTQALAVAATRAAYRSYRTTGVTGTEINGMGLHRELVELTGLDPLLDIERVTTERVEPTTDTTAPTDRPTGSA
ncbi:MAG: oxaloacetate decarboxylase [Acidimicrobiales bacterium]